MKIQLKNIKVNLSFSEETSCFKADIFIDNKKIGYASNDGHGGSTNYNAYEGKKDILTSVERYAESLPDITCGELNFSYKSSLESIIDNLIEDHLKQKDLDKLKKKMETNIIVGIPNGISVKMIGYGKNKLSDIIKTDKGRNMVHMLIDRLKKELVDGEQVLNTNLKELGYNK